MWCFGSVLRRRPATHELHTTCALAVPQYELMGALSTSSIKMLLEVAHLKTIIDHVLMKRKSKTDGRTNYTRTGHGIISTVILKSLRGECESMLVFVA